MCLISSSEDIYLYGHDSEFTVMEDRCSLPLSRPIHCLLTTCIKIPVHHKRAITEKYLQLPWQQKSPGNRSVAAVIKLDGDLACESDMISC